MNQGLSNKEIFRIVNRYIGVSEGYLGDFSYKTHHEFYLEYCDLDINPYEYEGTTRVRFIQILSESDPKTQAIILEGILEKYPVGSSDLRSQGRYDEIRLMASRCRSAAPVDSPNLVITSDVVERAIDDAETLILSSGATSGVDRVHTALHGYLIAVCDAAGISYGKNPSMTKLFKFLREKHPVFTDLGEHKNTIFQVLRSMSSTVDALNPARNIGSVAHPTENLLPQDEAMLFINAARTILHYLNAKISKTE